MSGRKLTPVQEYQAVQRVVELITTEGITVTASYVRTAREFGVSKSTVHRAVRDSGIDMGRFTPEFVGRRIAYMVRSHQLYSMVEKQRMAHEAAVMAEAELNTLSRALAERGEFTPGESVRLARVQQMLARAIGIDKNLVQAGIPIEGWTHENPVQPPTGEPEIQSSESLLIQARATRARLMAMQQGEGVGDA